MLNEYKRFLSAEDIKVLGIDWRMKIDKSVTATLSTAKMNKNPMSANSRVLSIMSSYIPMSVKTIVVSHNYLYGKNSMAHNYGRSIIHWLLKADLIKRVNHGEYVKIEELK